MSKGLKISLIVVGIVAVIAIILGGTYNSLVVSKEKVNNQYADVAVQLKRRADLIPNLVSTVKGYAAHETEVINSITNARAKLSGATDAESASKANAELTSALNRLMVVVENYPDLKANTNFIYLQDELAGAENRISVARKDYNDVVKTYNTNIKVFPKNIIAGMFGFEEMKYFEADESDYDAPNVDFE